MGIAARLSSTVRVYMTRYGNTSTMRMMYKPLGLIVSVLGGVVAGAIFKRVWRAAAHETEAPEATDKGKGWREVVTAAAAQGAIFGAVKVVIDRAGARGFERLTGTWPGPNER